MAFNDIETAYINSYKANIELQYQQLDSRIRSRVTVEQQQANRDFYDRIVPTNVVERTTRHADTPLIPDVYDRRAVTLRDFEWADLIDKQDRLRMLADPTSAYVRNSIAAFGRKMDNVICTAATGVAYGGVDGNTQITFPNSGSYFPAGTNQQIPVNYVESGTAANSNLTIGKLRKMRDILVSQEAVDEGEPINLILAQSQVTALLRTTEVTSSDFNTVKALVSGQVDEFMGFKFTRTQQTLLAADGVTRSVLAFPQRAIVMALGMDINVQVDLRPDKSYATQVYVAASFNATRLWEAQVVETLCNETL